MSKTPVAVATFYRFAAIADVDGCRERVVEWSRDHHLLGTVLIAAEGINGTLAGDKRALETVVSLLSTLPEMVGMTAQWTTAYAPPFDRLKVRIRDEIVTSGIPDLSPADGCHVGPDEWHALLDDPSVPVLDVRNRYEHRLGTFPGAQDPDTDSFREFGAWARDWVAATSPDTVAMFCTGGIRCEKAAAVLHRLGVHNVRQLDGGILGYLAAVDGTQNRWSGECFVFDERVSVDRHLQPGTHEVCAHCRMPVLDGERDLSGYEPGVSCHHCDSTLTDDRRRALRQRRAGTPL